MTASVISSGLMPKRLTMSRPGTLKEVIQRATRHESSLQTCFSEFLDEFYINLRPSKRNDLALLSRLAEEPTAVNPVIDAFLAATAEHLMTRWAVMGTMPDWINGQCRFLRGRGYNDGRTAEEVASNFRESPSAFRRRMLFVCGDPLRRARMPKDDRWWAYEELWTGIPRPNNWQDTIFERQ